MGQKSMETSISLGLILCKVILPDVTSSSVAICYSFYGACALNLLAIIYAFAFC